MSVGVITFHRALNYGAVLQCYALQEYLKSIGEEVYVIDYRQKSIESAYQFPWIWLMKKLLFPKKLFSFINYWANRRRTIDFFRDFQKKHLNTTRPIYHVNDLPHLDDYIIGSDQMWNTRLMGGMDPIYWGQFPLCNQQRLIGYAISSKEQILKEIPASTLQETSNHFDFLSFRESNILSFVEGITGKPYKRCIDPTLIVEPAVWEKLINREWENKNYIAIYQVRYLPENKKFLNEKAKRLSEKIGCEVIDISHGNYSVSDWLSIIKFAKCTLTTSFHATVFSLIFRTPIYAYKLNDGGDHRYTELLEDLEEGWRCYPIEKDVTQIEKYDERILSQQIIKYSEDSRHFLYNIFKQ